MRLLPGGAEDGPARAAADGVPRGRPKGSTTTPVSPATMVPMRAARAPPCLAKAPITCGSA